LDTKLPQNISAQTKPLFQINNTARLFISGQQSISQSLNEYPLLTSTPLCDVTDVPVLLFTAGVNRQERACVSRFRNGLLLHSLATRALILGWWSIRCEISSAWYWM